MIAESPYKLLPCFSTFNIGKDIKEWSCLGSICYKFFIDNAQWEDAVSRCSYIHSSGGLVAVTSSKINTFIQNITIGSIWIGLNDIREAGEITECSFPVAIVIV